MACSCSSTSSNNAVIKSTVVIRLSSQGKDIIPPSVEKSSDDCKPKPTVCPSNNSASLLSYQSLQTSSEVWRGHGQEAKRGSVGGPRITRHVKRWSRCSSRVSPPGCPWSRCGACSVPRLGGSRGHLQ